MKSKVMYLYRTLKEFLRYYPVCSRLLSRIMGLVALLYTAPLGRLNWLARALRLNPSKTRIQDLHHAINNELARLDSPIDWEYVRPFSSKNARLPKGIILKRPISPLEKGVLYLTFEDHWLRLLQSDRIGEISQRYDLVLGPSFSPPPDLELLLMIKLWPGKFFSLLGNLDDADLLRGLSAKVIPIPLLSSSWVDPHPFVPHLTPAKDYEVVMLANFASFKRHWRFFSMLRQLPKHYRVLLMGVPLEGRTDDTLFAEARAFGVETRFDLLVRPSRADLMSGLARSRVSLIFSLREGGCIAVAESLFANTPVGLFYNARIGARAFINHQTGILLRPGRLANQVQCFIECAQDYQPRDWALANISCEVSHKVLNSFLRQSALENGHLWTKDIAPFAKGIIPYYSLPETELEMAPWYEDFAAQYGLLVGPATTVPMQTTNPVAA